LDIKNSNVTDAGLKYVTGLTGLQWLYLHGSKVTYQGAMQIKRALPHCNVMR
jgi:hypothetical protein